MDNKTFWDDRYAQDPWLGSGPGSRGVAAHYKAHLLRRVIGANRVGSVIDIGCGDLCWLTAEGGYPQWMAAVDYTGVDISKVIVDRNKEMFPQCRFLLHDIACAPVDAGADLVLCFDVLLHQTDRAQFDAALANLLSGVRRHALVSYPDTTIVEPVIPGIDGLDESIEQRFQRELRAARAQRDFPTGLASCFGLLPDLIAELRPELTVRPVGQYRFQQVYAIDVEGGLAV